MIKLLGSILPVFAMFIGIMAMVGINSDSKDTLTGVAMVVGAIITLISIWA